MMTKPRLLSFFIFSIVVMPVFLVAGSLWFPRDTLTIYCVGDIVLARNVAVSQRSLGYFYPMWWIFPTLWRADILTGNLESVISDKGSPMDKKYVFRAEPSEIGLLETAGFDAVNIANNHSFDYLFPAFLDCINRLDKAGIAALGGGSNLSKARRLHTITKDGYIVGFLGFNDTKTNFLGAKQPATVSLSWGAAQESLAIADIRTADTLCDILVVQVHWNAEYSCCPTERIRELAHRFVDAGADIVAGHHPHRLQGVELYKNRAIAYSLGNFLMDQRDYLGNIGMILGSDWVGDSLIGAYLIPTETAVRPCSVERASGVYFNDVFDIVNELSSEFETALCLDGERLLIVLPRGTNQ